MKKAYRVILIGTYLMMNIAIFAIGKLSYFELMLLIILPIYIIKRY
jgi:hypothetical protein